jgi:hypothetical protein
MNNGKLTLSITHLIFLTEKERYAVVNGEIINTIGVSLPIWFFKGSTSEPAEEVFCRYCITNIPKNKTIEPKKTGYILNLPQKQILDNPISNEDWRKMTEEQRDLWYKSRLQPPSCQSLLNLKDGGAGQLTLKLAERRKIKKKIVSVIHFIIIRDMKILLESLTDTISIPPPYVN